MSQLLQTHSKFYYGYTVDQTNYLLNFKEGAGPELTASLNFGEYSFTEFALEIKRALDDAGALTYTVTANRAARTITIAAASNFKLLVSTGTNISSGTWALVGFTGADRTGASTYTGNTTSGSEYKPQLWLQHYVSSDDWQQAANASVNPTASGRVEIIKFGTQKFVQFQIQYINEFENGASQIRNDPQALANIRAFMQYVIGRSPIEFMPDESVPATFQTIALDSSPDSSTGTGYKLKELYDQQLPGYFETSILKFRVRED